MCKTVRALIVACTWLCVCAPPLAVSAGQAFSTALIRGRICMNVDEASALAEFAKRHAATVEALSENGGTVSVIRSGVSYHVSSTGTTASMDVPSAVSPAPSVCSTSPSTDLLASHRYEVPAAYAAGIATVDAYLGARPWDELTLSNAAVQVVSYLYGSSYVVVSVSSTQSQRNAGGLLSLGCSDEASFRYTIRTGQVYQFDGCVEPHVHNLPSFSQLPPE